MANCYTITLNSRDYIGNSLSAINFNFDTIQTIACNLSAFLKGVSKFGVNNVFAGPGITVTISNREATVSREDPPKWYVNENKAALLTQLTGTSLAVIMSADFLKHIQDVASSNITIKGMSTFVSFTTANFGYSTDSFRGGVRMLDGRVFMPRFNSTDSCIYNFKENITESVGGFGTTLSAFWGGVLLPDGKVFSIPFNNTKAVIYNINETISIRTSEVLWPNIVNEAFVGGTLLQNGNVLLSPYGMLQYGIYNTRTGVASNSAMPVGYTARSVYGCCLTPNGKVLFIPHNTTNFWVLKNGVIQSVDNTAPGFEAFRGGVLLKTGEVFCVPYNSSKAAIYNPVTDVVRYTSDVFSGLKAFETGTLLPDGRVFLCPAQAAGPAIFNPDTEELEYPRFTMLENDYYGCVAIDDNRVLLFPRNSTTGATFSLPCTESLQYSILTSPFINKL